MIRAVELSEFLCVSASAVFVTRKREKSSSLKGCRK